MSKFFLTIIIFSTTLLSCKKQYSGYCISGSNQAEYQVLQFVETAVSKNQAEKKVEKMLNEKFPTNGEWSCDVK